MSKRVKDALKEARVVLSLCSTEFVPQIYPRLVEREKIRELCEKHGYGAVMQTASQLWLQKDPMGAHTVGPCAGTVRDTISTIGLAEKDL